MSLQESYDNAGLICGNPEAEIHSVLLSTDITEEVIDEAVQGGHDLLISHHPLTLQGLKNLRPDSYVKRCLIKAIRHNLNIYSAHTNLDAVLHGVSGRMADKLGLQNRKILQPGGKLFSLCFYTPVSKAEEVRQAVLGVGGGHIGNYSHCSFNQKGEGTFHAEAGSHPYVGVIGTLHREEEIKTEITVPEYLLSQSIETLLKVHPYEEPVWNIVNLDNTNPVTGFGIIGELAEPADSLPFLQQVKKTFRCKVVRHTAICKSQIRKVAVCGGSGAGKTRFYCKPNLMQANTSFVILDPKGEIVRDVGNLLEKKGYEIRVLDLISMEKSHCYNPFVYLHSDNDVQRLVTNLFKSTTPKGSQSNDPFWDTSASMLLSALVYYLHYEAPEDEQNFAMVMEMLQAAAIDNEEDPRPSPLDCLFADLELDRPDHIALKYYRSYHTGSAKTLKSIQITLAARLEKFNLESLAALTCTDELDLASMGEKKVALFAIIPDNDSSFNFLVSILYTQLFQQLFFSADHIHGGALPIPVHFLMDEFANVSLPDDFDKILSVMRSRGVFVSIILQNLAQLKALFEKQWESIVGNCDEFLYLGGNEQSTHKYVSELLGKETIDTNTYGKSSGRSGNYSTNYQISGRELLTPDEVRMLDNRYAILFIRGELPVMDLKYDILKHPAVDLTADGKGGVYQHGKVTSNVATIEVQYLDPDTLPDTEVSETTYELLSDEDFNSKTNNNTTTKLRR